MKPIGGAVGRHGVHREQHTLGNSQVLSRLRVDVVLGIATGHDIIEGIISAEQEYTDQGLVVGKGSVAR